jgi:hypothetical protein
LLYPTVAIETCLFLEPLLCNCCFCWLHSSWLEQIYHNIVWNFAYGEFEEGMNAVIYWRYTFGLTALSNLFVNKALLSEVRFFLERRIICTSNIQGFYSEEQGNPLANKQQVITWSSP